jgi:hypothetical protein
MAQDKKSKSQAIKSIATKGMAGPLSHNISKYMEFADFAEKSFEAKKTVTKDLKNPKGLTIGTENISKSKAKSASEWAEHLYDTGTKAGTPFHFDGKIYTVTAPKKMPTFKEWYKSNKKSYASEKEANKAYTTLEKSNAPKASHKKV